MPSLTRTERVLNCSLAKYGFFCADSAGLSGESRDQQESRISEMRNVAKHRVFDNLDIRGGRRALMTDGYRRALVLAAALSVGACVLPPVEADAPATEPPAEVGRRSNTVPLPPVKPEVPVRRPDDGPADLAAVVGFDQDAVRDLLGEPIWVEEIPPALSWQYASDQCVLRVLFFMEVTTRNFRVLSYDVTSNDDANNVDQRCFSELVAQADGRRS